MHQSVQDILPTYLHISTNFNPHKPKLLEIVQDLIATVAYNYYNYTKLGIGYGDVYIGGKGSWIYFIEESGGDVTEAMYDSELLLFSTQVIIAHWSKPLLYGHAVLSLSSSLSKILYASLPGYG